MEQNIARPAVKPEPEVPSETARMKASYNRAGLGLTALYGVLQGLSSVVLIIGIVILALVLIAPRLESLQSGFRFGGFAGIMDFLREEGVMGWVIVLYALSMVAGMGGGILIQRLICRKEGAIERKTLSAGSFLKIVLFAYGLWGIGILLGNFPDFFGAEEQGMLDQLLDGLKWEALPMYLYVVIGAPFFEELACRKILLDRLHPYGEGFAVAASGLLFGILHGNSAQFFLAFLLGCLFAMVYLRTGKVIYTMILHAMINLTATVPDLVKLAGPDIGDIWMNYVIAGLGIIGCIVLLIKRKDPLLHPERTSIPDAAAAVWKNAGMKICRIAGLVLILAYDLVMMVMSLISSDSMLSLLRLIPASLAAVLILLLPRWTKRFEQTVPEQETEAANG